jgi:NAD(P)-dependent dehydrogenase (short-subunit alcohol dehydrogenase family)
VPSKTAVVTGGSGGIGKACGRVLAERGYDVVLVSRRPGPLRAAAREIGARWLAADCTDEQDITRIVDAAPAPTVLVHAAGIVEGAGILDHRSDVFDRVIAANLRSTYLLTRALLARMGPGSHLFFLSSTAGLKGVAGFSAYSASKAGMNAFATAVAAEVESDGIGVHLITPGPVRTEMLDTAPHGDLWLLEPEDVASAVGWIESLPPRVVVREIVMRAVMKGPFAPQPLPAEQA